MHYGSRNVKFGAVAITLLLAFGVGSWFLFGGSPSVGQSAEPVIADSDQAVSGAPTTAKEPRSDRRRSPVEPEEPDIDYGTPEKRFDEMTEEERRQARGRTDQNFGPMP